MMSQTVAQEEKNVQEEKIKSLKIKADKGSNYARYKMGRYHDKQGEHKLAIEYYLACIQDDSWFNNHAEKATEKLWELARKYGDIDSYISLLESYPPTSQYFFSASVSLQTYYGMKIAINYEKDYLDKYDMKSFFNQAILDEMYPSTFRKKIKDFLRNIFENNTIKSIYSIDRKIVDVSNEDYFLEIAYYFKAFKNLYDRGVLKPKIYFKALCELQKLLNQRVITPSDEYPTYLKEEINEQLTFEFIRAHLDLAAAPAFELGITAIGVRVSKLARTKMNHLEQAHAIVTKYFNDNEENSSKNTVKIKKLKRLKYEIKNIVDQAHKQPEPSFGSYFSDFLGPFQYIFGILGMLIGNIIDASLLLIPKLLFLPKFISAYKNSQNPLLADIKKNTYVVPSKLSFLNEALLYSGFGWLGNKIGGAIGFVLTLLFMLPASLFYPLYFYVNEKQADFLQEHTNLLRHLQANEYIKPENHKGWLFKGLGYTYISDSLTREPYFPDPEMIRDVNNDESSNRESNEMNDSESDNYDRPDQTNDVTRNSTDGFNSYGPRNIEEATAPPPDNQEQTPALFR